MDYIQGKPRSQIVLIESSLEELIELDNPVRSINAFVDTCKLEEFGFTHAKHAPEGRPPYHPGDLLKLYIYGYLNRIRSSRLLEKECKRNLELKWLLNELTPDHNTIANFRKDNPKAIKLVFRKIVTLCKRLDLIGGKVIAADRTAAAGRMLCASGKKTTTQQMTMNWNIKLDTENLTSGLTARHALPNRMCFNFFSHHTKILKYYCQRTSQPKVNYHIHTDAIKEQKEIIYTPIYIEEEVWKREPTAMKTFEQLVKLFTIKNIK